MRGLLGLVVAALQAASCTGGGVDALEHEIERGRVLYAANGCGTCHGQSGRGDGPVGKTLNPPPRDFRAAAAFKNGRDPSSVANTIATGLTRDGGRMQPYIHLSDRERHLLARFVISLRESPASPDAGASNAVRVSNAWVREPIGSRAMTAAYATIENPDATDTRITGASADVAGSVEMHEMTRAGDIMKMAPVNAVTVPARGTVEFKPGGAHLMLFDLTRVLKDGDSVTLTFSTVAGSRVTATAAVRKAREQE
jgi:copper(I)-binding protein